MPLPMPADQFHEAWTAAVARWARLRAEDPAGARDFLARLLHDGLEDRPQPPSAPEPTGEDAPLECAMELIALAGAFDAAMYAEANPVVSANDEDPLRHYCREGWRRARNPTRGFDVWWYVTEYLDPGDERVDPLVHYLLIGRRAGLAPLPPFPSREPFRHPEAAAVRRICLFAAYDVDGIVDDYVLAYLTELSRHADVYFLADGLMDKTELARLREVTVGAWAIPHGEYDFGSYSRLARDLVGWDLIESYDELLLVNDSCYLVRPLDDVFTRMDAAVGHWWGMQLTAPTYLADSDRELPPLPLKQAKARFQRHEIPNYHHFAHVGSYFLALRAPVIHDAGFRRRLDAVCRQRSKLDVIFKYETGTTRYLVGQGYDFATYVPEVLAFHPAYSAAAFTLIERGFPLLKRQLLAENPFDVPDLADWRQRLLRAVPEADVEMFDRNLRRVAADDKLQRAMAVRTSPDGTVVVPRTLSRAEFRVAARSRELREDWWAFPVRAADHGFAGGVRAVFEEVRDDPTITKVVLTGSRRIDVDGPNVHTVPLHSPEGQSMLMHCRQVIVDGSPRQDAWWPLPPKRHRVLSLLRAEPIGGDRYATPDGTLDKDVLTERLARTQALVVRSTLRPEQLAPVRAWPMGVPAWDLLVRDAARLPRDLADQARQLLEVIGERRLALVVPAPASEPTEDALDALVSWSRRHEVVLGLREHPVARARPWGRALAELRPLDLGWRRLPEAAVAFRASTDVVTDDPCAAADWAAMGGSPIDLRTGKPLREVAASQVPDGAARAVTDRLRSAPTR